MATRDTNRSIACSWLKDLPSSDFSKAIEINPKHAGAYCNRGIAKNDSDDLKGACEDWKKAAELGDEKAAEFLKEHCE